MSTRAAGFSSNLILVAPPARLLQVRRSASMPHSASLPVAAMTGAMAAASYSPSRTLALDTTSADDDASILQLQPTERQFSSTTSGAAIDAPQQHQRTQSTLPMEVVEEEAAGATATAPSAESGAPEAHGRSGAQHQQGSGPHWSFVRRQQADSLLSRALQSRFRREKLLQVLADALKEGRFSTGSMVWHLQGALEALHGSDRHRPLLFEILQGMPLLPNGNLSVQPQLAVASELDLIRWAAAGQAGRSTSVAGGVHAWCFVQLLHLPTQAVSSGRGWSCCLERRPG